MLFERYKFDYANIANPLHLATPSIYSNSWIITAEMNAQFVWGLTLIELFQHCFNNPLPLWRGGFLEATGLCTIANGNLRRVPRNAVLTSIG